MGFGDGFNPSKSDVASSTKSGGSLTQTHQFTGSVFITSSATSLSASNSISASAFIGDGSELTNLPGGGGGGAPTDAQYVVLAADGDLSQERVLTAGDGIALVDAGANGAITVSASAAGGDQAVQFSSGSSNKLSGSSNLTYNYNADTLTFTGTLFLSSSDGVPLKIAADSDATAYIGPAIIGDGGSTDTAYFAHYESLSDVGATFCVSQHSNLNTFINAPSTANRVAFTVEGSTKTWMNGATNFWSFGGGWSYTPSYMIDCSGSARIGTDETMTLYVTGAIDQSGSTSTFHIPDGNAGAFVISGSSDTGQGDPENGLYFGVNTAIKAVRTSSDFIIDGTKKLWLGTGSLVSNPESETKAGNGYIMWGTGENRLIIESTSGSTNGIKLSGSVTAPQIASGSIAGPGSYVGVSGDGLLVLTASSGGGGGGTPGGSDTQIQFNDGGSFGGQANLTYEKTQSTLFVSASQSIFSGSTIVTGSAAVGTAPSYDGQGGNGIALKVEGGGASSDQGKPVLVCQVTGTQNSGDVGYVGIGTAAPKIQLDIRWNPDLDPNTAGGDVVSFATGTTSPGALYYLNEGGGWVSASAANTGSGNDQLLGIALGNDAQQDGMLIKGWADVSNFYQDSFRAGKAVYIASASSAADEGKMSGSAPTAADSYARIVGYASPNASTIYFNPGTNWVELS